LAQNTIALLGLPEVQRRFLNAFATTGVIQTAADAAGIDRRNHQTWATDPETGADYLERFAAAQAAYADRLEGVLLDWASVGEERGVWWRGTRVGAELRKSEALLLAAVKARKPEYRTPDTLIDARTQVIAADADALVAAMLRARASAAVIDASAAL
jgi:hypothetical protein